jgi:hypothetical protein
MRSITNSRMFSVILAAAVVVTIIISIMASQYMLASARSHHRHHISNGTMSFVNKGQSEAPLPFIYSAWNNATGEKVFLPVPTSYALTSTSLQNHPCSTHSSINTTVQQLSDERIYKAYVALANPTKSLYWCSSNVPQPVP